MKKGFTLLEMLAVVMVVAILAAVAMPQYRRSIERTRLAEATQMLPVIYDAVDRYFVAKPVGLDEENNTDGKAVLKKEAAAKEMAVVWRRGGFADIAYEAETAGPIAEIPPYDNQEVIDKVVEYELVPAEEAPMLPAEEAIYNPAVVKPIFVKEKEVPAFSELDVSLKGTVGADPNIWETSNFTYVILPLDSKNAFVIADTKRGKYAGTRFAYDGNQIYCYDEGKGVVKGACALMNLESIHDSDVLKDDSSLNPKEELTREDLKDFSVSESAATSKTGKATFVELK